MRKLFKSRLMTTKTESLNDHRSATGRAQTGLRHGRAQAHGHGVPPTSLRTGCLRRSWAQNRSILLAVRRYHALRSHGLPWHHDCSREFHLSPRLQLDQWHQFQSPAHPQQGSTYEVFPRTLVHPQVPRAQLGVLWLCDRPENWTSVENIQSEGEAPVPMGSVPTLQRYRRLVPVPMGLVPVLQEITYN